MLVLRFNRRLFQERASEWFMAALLLSHGSALVLQPLIFAQNPVYRRLAEDTSQAAWALAFLFVGLLRLAALTINGAWRRSPHLRAITAFFACFVWFQLSVGVFEARFPNLGVAIYPLFLAMDIYSVYRAMGDAGAADSAARARVEA